MKSGSMFLDERVVFVTMDGHEKMRDRPRALAGNFVSPNVDISSSLKWGEKSQQKSAM